MPSCEQDSNCNNSKDTSRKNDTKPHPLKNKLRHASAASSKSSSSSSSSSSWTSSDLSLPPPPDGGWGWVIVLASFFANFIADGCAYSYGVLYVELLSFFEESRSKTSLVGALFISVPLITGPIASALTNKYGCRKVTMSGGVICAIGFIISSFVRNINLLCFTFGIIAGFGLALVYVPTVVIVAFYFEKRRAFATGLAVAGAGIGTFTFSPMIDLLIEEYAWHGTFLILGAVMLNIVVCGALFRPLVPQKILWARHKQKSRERFSRVSSKASIGNGSGSPSPFIEANGFHFEAEHAGMGDARLLPTLPEEDLHVTHSLVQIPTYLQKQPVSPDLLRSLLLSQRERMKPIMEGKVCKQPAEEQANGGMGDHAKPTRPSGPSTNEDSTDTKMLCPKQPKVKIVRLPDQYPMFRKDIFYRGSVSGNFNKVPLKASSCPDVFLMTQRQPALVQKRRSVLCLSGEAKRILHRMLDFSILRSVIFVYFCLHSLMLSLTYDIPYMYLVDKAIQMGIPEPKSSFLVSIIGITSTFGQIFAGFMGDQKRVNSLVFYNIMTTMAGACTIFVPLLISFETLAVYSSLYGFFISANYAMTTIIIVELLDMDRLTNAFGLVSLAEGVANLAGPPLAGFISDQTGEYNMTFYIFGSIMMLSGLMLFAVPCLKPYDKLSQLKSSSESISESDSESGVDDLDEESRPKSPPPIANGKALLHSHSIGDDALNLTAGVETSHKQIVDCESLV